MIINKLSNLITTLIYLLSISQVAKKTILSNTLEYSPWSYSELLISYPSIFIRRGFIGELITLFDSDTVLFDTVNIFIFVNFVVFCLLSYMHIKISKLNAVQHLLYLISIFGILNITLFNQYYHRKEIFVLNLFMITLLLIRFKIQNYFLFIFTLIFSVLMVLIHEGIAMLAIAFIILILKNKTQFSSKMVNVYSSIVLLSFMSVIISTGNDSVANLIWTNLSEFDRNLIDVDVRSITKIEPNAITAIGWSLSDSFFKTTQVLIFSGSMFLWTFYFFMFLWTFNVIFKIEFNKTDININRVKDFLLMEKYFIVVPILFIVGFDWGRWIFSLFHLSFISYLLFIGKSNRNVVWSFPIISFILVSMLTIMPECCLQMEGTTITSNYYRVLKSIQFTIQSALN